MFSSQKKCCSGKSAGVIIIKNKKILLIDRANFPFGWACPAGHIDKNEVPEKAITREVKEETGLIVKKLKLLLQKNKAKNQCSYGTKFHDWWVFECQYEGELKIDKKEAKRFNWFEPKEIKKLQLEPIWKIWFKELKII